MGADDAPSPARTATPPCPHFGTCGGCAAQDMDATTYRNWKRGFVEAALRRKGIMVDIAELVEIPAASRRRARFYVSRGKARDGGKVQLGFNAAGSHTVVDMTACPVLEPQLFALTGPLRDFFTGVLDRDACGEAEVLLVDGALDVVLRFPGPLDMEMRERLVEFAGAAGIARLSWQEMASPNGTGGRGRPVRGGGRRRGRPRKVSNPGPPEIIAALHAVRATFGSVPVSLPPLAFLQASKAGEAALCEAVIAGVPEGAVTADLFSGAGTFTFPLADGRRVAAFDGDEALIGALNGAARASDLGSTVEGTARNLTRRPLMVPELNAFDAVVLDPPRAGAEGQVRMLAQSTVPVVMMVSCNPESFARDARILLDGGYQCGLVIPVDQFVWTRHLELVAKFSR